MAQGSSCSTCRVRENTTSMKIAAMISEYSPLQVLLRVECGEREGGCGETKRGDEEWQRKQAGKDDTVVPNPQWRGSQRSIKLS